LTIFEIHGLGYGEAIYQALLLEIYGVRPS